MLQNKLTIDQLTIILPVFNEEDVIVNTLTQISRYCDTYISNYEIIVVDDGSVDSTRELVLSYNSAHVRLVTYEINRGKGYAIRQGIIASTKKYILMCDADLSTDISEIEKLDREVLNADVVIGSRGLDSSNIIVAQPWYKVLLGRLGNKLIRIFLNLPFQDTQCGFKLFNEKIKLVLPYLKYDRFSFDFELLAFAQRTHLTITEVPVCWKNNFNSSVKAKDYLRVLFDLARLCFRLILK